MIVSAYLSLIRRYTTSLLFLYNFVFVFIDTKQKRVYNLRYTKKLMSNERRINKLKKNFIFDDRFTSLNRDEQYLLMLLINAAESDGKIRNLILIELLFNETVTKFMSKNELSEFSCDYFNFCLGELAAVELIYDDDDYYYCINLEAIK